MTFSKQKDRTPKIHVLKKFPKFYVSINKKRKKKPFTGIKRASRSFSCMIYFNSSLYFSEIYNYSSSVLLSNNKQRLSKSRSVRKKSNQKVVVAEKKLL